MMDADAVTGVTSNPTIFQKALSQGDAYDERLRELLATTDDDTEIFFDLALQDIREACDVLMPAYDASGGVDGYVSMEVLGEPRLRHRGHVRAGALDRRRGRPPNLYVKIPATMAGLPAIEDCTAHGTPINITLIFGLDRYKAVVEAYLRGLERLVAGGGDPSKVVSVASFFVSRVDTEADKRLDAADHPGSGASSRSRTRSSRTSTTWRLRGAALGLPRREGRAVQSGACGRRPRRKNPSTATSCTSRELIGPQTVNTMPLETIEAFRITARCAATPCWRTSGSTAAVRRPRCCGRRLRGRDRDLETEGVQKFADSYKELTENIRSKKNVLAAA